MTGLTAEQIVDMRVPSQLRISPDGATIGFVVAPLGRAGDHPVSEIWIAPADGSAPARRFTSGVAHDIAPRWSHDGEWLFFLSDRANRGVLDLYRMPMRGGESERLTTWACGIDGYQVLPDGKRVIFTASDPKTDEEEKRAKEKNDAQVFGQTWRPSRLRLLTIDTKAIETLDCFAPRHVADFNLSQDSSQLAVVTWETPELDRSLIDTRFHLLDTETWTESKSWQLPADGGSPIWSADGTTFWYLGHTKPGWRGGYGIWRLPLEATEPELLTEDLPACPYHLFSSQSGEFALLARGLDSELVRFDGITGDITTLQTIQGNIGGLAISTSGDRVAAIVSTAHQPPDVWSGSPSEPWTRLSDLNPWTRELAWGTQLRLDWTADDDLVIDGLYVLPVGTTEADGPFPTIVVVHGGPYGRWADGFNLSWGPNAQWLATAGYGVLLPNPRGGLGHGTDFADRVSGRVGFEDWGDIQAGIEHVIQRGLADPDRLAIGGWSQGGFMTAWAVGQTDRFKAGVMGAGVSDWGMMVAESDMMRFEADLGGSFGWEGFGPHSHDRVSPISFAHKVKTPVMILHGGNDARVPVSQGRYFARALRYHGCPYELVVYPREPHGIQERLHQIDLLNRLRSWYQQWLPVAIVKEGITTQEAKP
jgi:dipeptidyl aminopeptidase/acylaminoacyl peptidase